MCPACVQEAIMVRATFVCAAVVLCAASGTQAQEPSRSDGWVVIPIEDYRSLRLRAFPLDRPPDPPPVEATLTRLDYDLRVSGDSIAGEARLTIDVLREGWVRVQIPTGLLVRSARIDGRAVPLIDAPAPHVLLSKAGRAVLALDIVVPLTTIAGSEALTLSPSPVAVSRVALVIPRAGIDVAVTGGVLAERPQDPEGRWVAYGRTGQPLTLTWKRRTEDVRASQALRWRGRVTEIVGLGEETSPVTATIRVDVVQGVAASVDVAIAEGLVVNQVSGPLVADWDFRPGTVKVNFLEPLTGQTTFAMTGEARVPRDGPVSVPLVRLPAAERETGGVAVEVLGAGEIGERQPRGLDPADPSDLGEPLAGRESPSMVAFRFRPQEGRAARSLAVNVARYTPQAVLIAIVEEARYDALVGEEGKTMVRARYAVRNNQRAFLAMTLPPGATLWGAAVGGRPIRPGISPAGSLLLPLEKGRAGEETPAFSVEVTYVERGNAWDEKGRSALALPALDLPISRTGVVLHHSPRFRLTPEPGAFRVEPDAGPFTAALRSEVASPPPPPPPPAAATPAPVDELVAQFKKDSAGRTVTGPLPVRMPFPDFGPSVFLRSELTAESQAPSLQFSYKRESRW
jgi:hypothetical protein